METYSKKAYEKMDKFLQTSKDSVGTQFHGTNTTIAKKSEEADDRYQQINERIANMEKKISVMDEKKVKIEMTNPTELMSTRIKAKL